MSASSAVAPVAPQSYAPIAAGLEADFRAQLDLILRYLPLAHSLRDSDRAGYYLRRLLALLDQRYELSPSERVQLVQTVLALLLDAQELHLQIRCLQVAVSLLHTKADLASLSIAWRPLFDLLASLHFPSARTFTYPQSLLKQHSAQLVKLIHAARRYFPATAGREVWEAFSPFLSPFDNASTRSFSLIALFTPTHTAEQAALFTSTLPTLLQYEGWYDHSPSALLPFFSLYARLSKHQVGVFSLLPHLPSLVSVYLQLLELDVGSQLSANPARVVHAFSWLNEKQGGALEELSKYLAQVLVYHLHLAPHGKERSALSLLSQFLHTVNTYYHPSNQGKWSGPLAALLGALGEQYAKRRGREANGTAKYPSSSFLPAANNDFVSVLLPIALQALFSKSHTMVSASEKWLKHVAYFHPSLVLPALMSHVYPALDDLSSPHRMLSIMQALSQLAPILFHRRYYPQGAAHLDALLWACLPGVDAIDAMKTSLTLTWFTIVFYHVPFIDARKADSLRRSATDREDAPRPRVVERITSRFAEVSDSGGVEAEDSDPRPMDEDEEDVSEDDAKAATFRFEDWAFAFLDALFRVLHASDAFAKTDALDLHSARLLGKVMRAFWACQSVDIFLACAGKVVKAVLGQQHTNAQKQWGIIVATASLAHPEVLLPKLFDPLYTRLVSTKAGVQTLNPLAKSDLDWSLYLASQVVKQAAGATGSHVLLPYKDKVVALHRLTCEHDERSVRKASGKLLRNFLSALCSVYPAEWRPFDGRQWSDVDRWQHWNLWCAYTPKEERDDAVIDPRIHWHVPSDAEMAVVDDVVNTHLAAPLATLTRFINAASPPPPTADEKAPATAVGKGDGPIERALLRVANIVRGAQYALGDLSGAATHQGEEEGQDEVEQQSLAAADAAFTGARCPLVTAPRSRPLRPVKNAVEGLQQTGSIRAALLPFLHRLTGRLLSTVGGEGGPSLKALSLHIRVLALSLLSYGANEAKLTAEQYIAGFTRQWMREYRSGFRVAARPLLVQRAYHYHLTRVTDAARSQPYTADVRVLLGDLHLLATNDFGRVRQRAHKALVAAVFHFPQSIDYALTALTSTLSSPSSNTEAVSGALSVLADPTVIALSTRRWSRLTTVVDALARGTGLKDDKTEVLLQTYFTALFPSLYPLPITIPALSSTPSLPVAGLDAARWERRRGAIERYNAANAARYRTLVASLLSYAQDPALHWRYQLMSTAFLHVLLAPSALSSPAPPSTTSLSSPSVYDEVVGFFARTLTSELAPMRHIANEALANILGMHFVARAYPPSTSPLTPPTPSSPSTPSAPSASVTRDGRPLSTAEPSDADWPSTVFYDYLYSGWQDEPPVTTWYTAGAQDDGLLVVHRTPSPYFTSVPPTLHPHATPLSPSALSSLSTVVTASFPPLISSLVYHHPSLEAKVEGSSASSAQGAGDTIAKLVSSHFAAVLWPFTRIQAQSKAFDFVHCALIRGLVEALPSLADANGPLHTQLLALVATPELDRQCTAAEVTAGIIKASKHLPYGRQRAVQSWLLPVVLGALTGCPPDAVSHWTAALRFVYSNMDPRRLAWLTRPLVLAAFGAVPEGGAGGGVGEVTSPLVQYKRFHFLTPVLVEQGYRCAALCAWTLDRIVADRWLYSPYKQVRGEVAWLVFLCLENQFKVTKGAGGLMERVVDEATTRFLAQTHATLQALSAALHKGGDRGDDVGADDATADMEDDAPPAVEKKDERKDEASGEGKLYLETVLSSLLVSLLAGSLIALAPAYQVYLPHVIAAQHVTDVECAALGRQVAKVAAWASLKGNVTAVEGDAVVVRRAFDAEGVVASVMGGIRDLMASGAGVSWHVKVSALRYLQVVIPRHSLLMTAAHVTDVEATVMAALVHPQVEVREAAALTLQSLLSACLSHPPSSVVGFSSSTHASAHVQRLVKALMALARTNYRDRSKRVDGPQLAVRHGGVLGLLACVACHPYDLPRHLPEVLNVLSGYVNDPQPVAGAVKKGFAEFMRTHKEEWEAFKDKFSAEQLDAVNSVQSAPTYFA